METFKDIAELYRANNRKVMNYDQELRLIQQYQKKPEIMGNHILTHNDIFYFSERKMKPDPEKFRE